MTRETATEIMEIIAAAKSLAQGYRAVTRKPLGEVAEFDAARLLNLQLVDARQVGYDAIRMRTE